MAPVESVPCVGCAFCCSERICRIGGMIYGHYKSPCPALSWDGNRFLCQLYLSDPSRYEGVLEIGAGCCFPTNSRRREIAKEPWKDTEGIR